MVQIVQRFRLVGDGCKRQHWWFDPHFWLVLPALLVDQVQSDCRVALPLSVPGQESGASVKMGYSRLECLSPLFSLLWMKYRTLRWACRECRKMSILLVEEGVESLELGQRGSSSPLPAAIGVAQSMKREVSAVLCSLHPAYSTLVHRVLDTPAAKAPRSRCSSEYFPLCYSYERSDL